MIYTPMTKAALKLCFQAHKDQVDKSGLPYVFHPYHLAEQMPDEVTATVALLHDVAEDTAYSLEALAAMGYPPAVLEPLALLIHDPAVPYFSYVEALRKNPVAVKVKLADLRHNRDLSRLNTVTARDMARAEKYDRAIARLEEAECTQQSK